MMSSYNSSCFGKIVSFLVVLFGPNLKFVSKEVPLYWYYFLILLIYILLLLSSARSVSYNAIFQRRSAFYQWMHQTRRILIVPNRKSMSGTAYFSRFALISVSIQLSSQNSFTDMLSMYVPRHKGQNFWKKCALFVQKEEIFFSKA